MARDSLADVLTTDDISKREMAMDKELIQLIQAACKADNSPRAIELTKLLHHTISFDMAIKVAAFYHLVGLQEKMEILKTNREEEEDRLEVARNKRLQWITPDPLPRHLPSSVSSSSKRADPLQDFGPPRPVYRPGLARAIPVAASSSSSSNSHANGVHPNPEEPHIDPITPESKRKRSVDDEMDGEDELSKRRALDEPMAASSTKPSASADNPKI
jgi:chromosome transmission fidelity protein 4